MCLIIMHLKFQAQLAKEAGAFYQQYGFRAGGAAGGRLMLPMAEIAASLQQGGIR